MGSQSSAVSLGGEPNIEDSMFWQIRSFWMGEFTKNCFIHGWVSNHEKRQRTWYQDAKQIHKQLRRSMGQGLIRKVQHELV